MAAASADDESPTPAGDAEAVDAGAPPGSGWASLPAPALLQVFAALPLAARLTLRLACHAFASALADAFGGVRADAPSLRAGRAAAARALARACPRAAHALLSVPAAGQPGDGAAAARALRIFLATKPRLARLHIQQLPASPAWGPAAAAAASPAAAAEDCEDLLAALASAAADSCAGSADGPVELPGEDAAAAKHAAAEPEAASAAPRLRALELDLTSAPPPASLASLSLFTSLREVRLRLRPPHRSGVAPAGVREVARLPLEALALPVDSSDPREAWLAVRDLPAAPAGRRLTQLQLRFTRPGDLAMPASWLLGFPRLRRLACGHALSLDLAGFDEAAAELLAAQRHRHHHHQQQPPVDNTPASQQAAAGPPIDPGGGRPHACAARAALPPLEHLELDQASLPEPAWRALAAATALGGTLSSLCLSRTGLPPRGLLLRLGAPAPGGGGSAGSYESGTCDSAAGGAPFPALRGLEVGVPSEEGHLDSAAALTGLESLGLHHLRCGARRFGPGAPQRLAPLSRLMRLVLSPASEGWETWGADAAGAAARRGAGELDGAETIWPGIVYYSGPRLR